MHFYVDIFDIKSRMKEKFILISAVPCPVSVLIFVRFLGLQRLTMALNNSNLIKGIMAAVGPILAGKLPSRL